jgi:CO dehydrogenase/acetyl-CoA synthase epsilon subunit
VFCIFAKNNIKMITKNELLKQFMAEFKLPFVAAASIFKTLTEADIEKEFNVKQLRRGYYVRNM